MYNELENKFIKSDKFFFNNGWRAYYIEIGLDDEDYIHIYNEVNSYYTYFKIDEIDKFYNLLEDCRTYMFYDDEEEDEYHPDEIDTAEWKWMFNDEFRGNLILDEEINNTEKVVREFMNNITELSVDNIKNKISELSSMPLYELQRINNYIEKVVANG